MIKPSNQSPALCSVKQRGTLTAGSNDFFIGLAPMAGLTGWPMRVLCYRMGASYACTEMVSAIGLITAKPGNPTYSYLLATHCEESNTACQVFGHDPIVLGEAVAQITELGRFTSIDLNMGCPARKITRSGEGSALLQTPELAYKLMLSAVRNTHLPVTVKTRIRYNTQHEVMLDIAEAAENLGLMWVCIHGRTQEQQYSGLADYSAIATICSHVSIPIIANGDVSTPESAISILKETGASGMVIGRGAIGNPWLLRNVRNALMGSPPSNPSLSERIETAILHAEMTIAYKGEYKAIHEMRKHVTHYLDGIHGAVHIRRVLNQVQNLIELKEALYKWLMQKEGVI